MDGTSGTQNTQTRDFVQSIVYRFQVFPKFAFRGLVIAVTALSTWDTLYV